MNLQERLAKRFEDEICTVCVKAGADGCTLPDNVECPVFRWATDLAQLVDGMDSDKVGDYLDQIQTTVCPNCEQDEHGKCSKRDHLDCPLDVYAGLIVQILEEELKR